MTEVILFLTVGSKIATVFHFSRALTQSTIEHLNKTFAPQDLYWLSYALVYRLFFNSYLCSDNYLFLTVGSIQVISPISAIALAVRESSLLEVFSSISWLTSRKKAFSIVKVESLS